MVTIKKQIQFQKEVVILLFPENGGGGLDTFGEKARKLRLKAGYKNRSAFARLVGVTAQAIQQIENGTTKEMSGETVAGYMRVLGLEAMKELGFILKNVEVGPQIKGKYPIISWIQAGKWREVIDNLHPGDAEEYVNSIKNGLSPYTYALRVRGDSMEPEFFDGDIIIVDPYLDPNVGDFVIAKIDDEEEATFKRYGRDAGHIVLSPLNRAHKSFSEPDFRINIVGVVVEKSKKYR